MQKIIFCSPLDSEYPSVSFQEVNTFLENGWEVKSITSQNCHCAVGTGYSHKVFGGFTVVIEKSQIMLETDSE